MVANYFSFLLISIIIIFWYTHFTKPQCEEILLEEAMENVKTGDLILFKSLNNINSNKMFNYFTHIGMVVIDPVITNNEPYIFESHGFLDVYRSQKILENEHVCITPLKQRIERYLGFVYHKPISGYITGDMHLKLINFVFYALKNMEYDYNIVSACIRNKFMGGKCGNKTNCGETIFLSLINMGLLSPNLWNKSVFHYLKWMCNIKNLNYPYHYLNIREIIKNHVRY